VVNGNNVEQPRDIANTLASIISFDSSNEHYTLNFQKCKARQGKQSLKFHSDNSESYNLLFSITELQDALHQARYIAAGPDEIHYQMLKHLREPSLCSLLEISITFGQQAHFLQIGQKLP
jgi:hypothetical protein